MLTTSKTMGIGPEIKTETICFVAGRSGGHLIPCLTQAQALRHQNSHTKIMLFSTDAALDKKIVADYPWIDRYIPLRLDNIPYRKFWLWPLFGLQLINCFYTSFMELRSARPTKIISMGGFTTIPVCLAAKTLGIPIELYELNVVPGKAVKLLVPFAQKINIVFGESAHYFKDKKTHLVPYPIRFNASTRLLTAIDARKILGLPEHKKTLLILGGSQGSMFINQQVKKWIEQLNLAEKINLQVIHQTGHHDNTNWDSFYAEHKIPAIIFDFNASIEHCYAATDLVICRAGAGTLFEVQFFGKECITIPLETNTTLHQRDNGFAMSAEYPEQFTVLEQKIIERKPKILFTMLSDKLFETTKH